MKKPKLSICGLPALCGLLLLSAACTTKPRQEMEVSRGIDPARLSLALQETEKLRDSGRRVWCVPFARNLSGVNIRGNADTWWGQARGEYARGQAPRVGAVMAFAPTRSMSMGHVAVVADVVSPRKVLVDHANWHRNKVSLKMAVEDVSDSGDWSAVRVESNPGAFGSVYPLNGFIYPTLHD